MGRIFVIPENQFLGEPAKQYSGRKNRPRLELFRPDNPMGVRLSMVSINFPLIVNSGSRSEREQREIALSSWYSYCDLRQIAAISGEAVRYKRDITSDDPNARVTTSGPRISDTGDRTHITRLRWRDVFSYILEPLQSHTLGTYTWDDEEHPVENLKIGFFHPHYKRNATPVPLDVLRSAVRTARQEDGSVKDLFDSNVLAFFWFNPTRASTDLPRDGSSRAYKDDKLIANLIISPEIPGEHQQVISRSSIRVSHLLEDGLQELYVREFDCRRQP
jgi:hypothetical protein